MRLRFVPLLGMMVVAVCNGLTAQARPDFSGTWTNVANDPPNLTEMNIVTGVRGMGTCETFTIEHTARALTIVSRPPGQSQPVSWSHALDGPERTDTTRSGEVTSRATWRGDEVVLTMSNRKMLREEDITQVIRLSPGGKLMVTTSTVNRRASRPEVTRVFEAMDVRQCKQLELERFRSRSSAAGAPGASSNPRGPATSAANAPSPTSSAQIAGENNREAGTASTATQRNSSAPSSAVETTSASNQLGLTGVYVGTYQCAQGSTRLTLTVTERANGLLTALFTFYPPGPVRGAKSDSFSFRLTGRYNPSGDTRLTPRMWEVRPPPGSGYAVVGRPAASIASARRSAATFPAVIVALSASRATLRNQRSR